MQPTYGQETLLEKLLRHYKLLIVLSFVIVVLLVLNGFAFVRINVMGVGTDKATIQLRQDGKEAHSFKAGQLKIIPKGTFSLRANTEDALTETHATFHSFRISTATLQLVQQQNLKKVSGASLGCVFAGEPLVSARTVYSFACNNPQNVTSYSFQGRPVVNPVTSKQLYSAAAYKQGLLAFVAGLEGDDELRLAYVEPNKTTPLEYLANPLLDNNKYQILPIGTSDAFFVVDGNKGELLYFKSTADKSPQKVTFGQEGKEYNYSSSGKAIFVHIIDEPKGTDESDPDSDDEERGGGTLKLFTTDNNTLKEASSMQVPDDINLGGFKTIDTQTLLASNFGGETEIYRLEGKTLKHHDSIQSTDDTIVHKNTLIYRQGNDYLKYNVSARQAQLLYRMQGKQLPSRMQSYSDQLVFTTMLRNSNKQFSFLVEDKPRTNGLEQILDYPASDITIRATDYQDQTIYVEFALKSFTSDRATGKSSYDPQEIADRKNKFVQRLKDDGFDPNKYVIVTP